MLKYLSVLWKTKTVLVCWQTILTITNAKYKNEKRKKENCRPLSSFYCHETNIKSPRLDGSDFLAKNSYPM